MNRLLPHALGVLVVGARGIYSALKLLPVKPKVVLMTRDLKQVRTDFRLITEAVERKHPDHEVKLIRHRKFSPGYLFAALREMYHLATCRAILVDGYIVPVSVLNHREGTPVGQVWHAMGGFKNFGYLTAGTPEGPDPQVADAMRMHANYTFLCAVGTVPAEVFTRAFQVAAETIKPYGMARIDYLLDANHMAAARQRVLKRHPELAQGRTVLYAPTSRRLGGIPYEELAEAFRAQAGEDDHLVIIPHPQDRSRLSDGQQTLLGNGVGALDWLSAADAVITDYSAIVYETALRDIPTIFFAYDLEEFRAGRGFPLDFEAEVPGPIATTAEDAAHQALTLKHIDYRSWRARHLDYITDDDGALPAEPPRCAERIVDALELNR